MNELVEQNFTSYIDTVSREPILFGDYRNALTEDPRLYEDVVDYEAAKAIFDEVSKVPLVGTTGGIGGALVCMSPTPTGARYNASCRVTYLKFSRSLIFKCLIPFI